MLVLEALAKYNKISKASIPSKSIFNHVRKKRRAARARLNFTFLLPNHKNEIREAVSSNRELKVVPPTVTLTTIGWSPAIFKAPGKRKSNV